jgi:hypothetical protein
MPRSAADIANIALQRIGEYSVYDEGADEGSFSRALEQLDLLIKELVGTRRFWWFAPATQEITLQAGISTYDLFTELNTDLQFINNVQVFANNREEKLKLLRRSEFEEYRNTEDLNNNDNLIGVYIERTDTNPQMTVFPAPLTDTVKLKVQGYKYSDDMTNENGLVPTGFPEAWERCLTFMLAIDCGLGAITSIPANELATFQNIVTRSEKMLETLAGRENVRRPRFTKPRSF